MIVAFLEFIILIVKIVVLASLYSTIVVFIISIINKKSTIGFLKKTNHNKRNLWLVLFAAIVLLSFQYRFSYSRNTGLGEHSVLPIGHGQTIENTDGETTYFFPDSQKTELNKDELSIGSFMIKNGMLYAEIADSNSDQLPFQFIVYNIAGKTLRTFDNKSNYAKYASENKLPVVASFYGFGEHYYEYTNKRPKWKKWLLP